MTTESRDGGTAPEPRAVRLAPGVTLLLEGPAAAIDPDALRDGARPLLDLLARTAERPGVPDKDTAPEKGPRP
jgi:hypothetical protein